MPSPAETRRAWRKGHTGLGFARRGSALVVASGLLVLGLGHLGRAGCGNPALPEIRSLMQYQSVLFHAALLLGFLMLLGGQWWSALAPLGRGGRRVTLGAGLLAAVATLVMTSQAGPGAIPTPSAPPGDSGQLVAALLGSAAIAASGIPVMLVAARLGDHRLLREVAYFGAAFLVGALANAEAASGLILSAPLPALYTLGVVALLDIALLWWLAALLGRAEALIQHELSSGA